MHYAFQLGRESKISTAELQAVFSVENISIHSTRKDNQYLIIETKEKLDLQYFMSKLGGTIKILEGIDDATMQRCNNENELIDKTVSYLDTTLPTGKVHFSLSGSNANKIAIQIKKELKAIKRSVRYIEPKNTATILHNKLVEKQTDLTLIGKDIFVTRAIQPIEEFGERDFGRPGRDDKSGMLPPKLAKILINLSKAKASETILDPFCGSGTIIMEALLMGFQNIIGTDISPKAIDYTKQNLKWLQENNQQLANKTISELTKLFQLDVNHIAKKFEPNSISAIIFEPFMGKPLTGKESKSELVSQANELSPLYTNAFKNFHSVLVPGGTVTAIIPKFKLELNYSQNKKVNNKGNDKLSPQAKFVNQHSNPPPKSSIIWIKISCIEKIEKLGFSLIPLTEDSDSLLYHRKNQHVGREIWQFKKQ